MEVQLKVDSKGRICLPSERREEIGGIVTAKRALKGILIQRSRKRDFLDEFREIIAAEPERMGEPENWPPEKMKALG